MPDGRVTRIDKDRECVYLVRGGRSYEAPISEVEPAARVPSARVHFTLHRSNGVEHAENVTLREGTRTNRRQRRFGDLTGARQPGSKTRTATQREYGIDVTTQPFRVVRAWIAALAARDIDAVASFYRPGAVIHTAEGPIIGRNRICNVLESSPWLGQDPELAELHGMDRYVEASHAHGDLPTITFLIESGEVAEQWMGVTPPEEDVGPAPDDSRVLVKGTVPSAAIEYANDRIDHFRQLVGRPVNDFLFKLTQAGNPSTERPAMVEASAYIDGTLFRAHVAATTMFEGIDLATARLRTKLEHHPDQRAPRPTPAADGSRRGDQPAPETGYFERPKHERELVRHKSFAPDEMTIDEAAWDMEQMDYDFFLFSELASGADCLLERDSAGDLHLHGLPDPAAVLPGVAVEVVAHNQDPPSLGLRNAIDFLDTAGSRQLFFGNADSGRRNVLYRRFDGHYGLITPVVSS